MSLWPFRRRPDPPREVTLDDASLDRAIRAGVQFPLDWFLVQTPEVQETIASRRDAWLEEVAVVMGYAALDPERTRLALAAEDGDAEAEGQLAALNARQVAELLGRRAASGGAGEPQRAAPATMGGLGKRRAEAAAARLAERPAPAPLGAEEVRR